MMRSVSLQKVFSRFAAWEKAQLQILRFGLLGVMLLLLGCGEPAQITEYTVPKSPAEEEAAPVNQLPPIPVREVPSDWVEVTPEQPGMPGYKLPPDWAKVATKPNTLATYQVAKDGQQTEMTVIGMPQMPDQMLLANINRWRVQQLQLPPIEAKDVPTAMVGIPIGKLQGRYLKLAGPETPDGQKAILVAFLDLGGKTWYFKLYGDADLTLKEETRFQTFVQSVRFSPN